MRLFDFSSSGSPNVPPLPTDALRRVVIRSRLNRVLEFTRFTIHDVVNNPVAKNAVLAYWRLSKQIDRSGEIGELERQWNPTGRS